MVQGRAAPATSGPSHAGDKPGGEGAAKWQRPSGAGGGVFSGKQKKEYLKWKREQKRGDAGSSATEEEERREGMPVAPAAATTSGQVGVV